MIQRWWWSPTVLVLITTTIILQLQIIMISATTSRGGRRRGGAYVAAFSNLRSISRTTTATTSSPSSLAPPQDKVSISNNNALFQQQPRRSSFLFLSTHHDHYHHHHQYTTNHHPTWVSSSLTTQTKKNNIQRSMSTSSLASSLSDEQEQQDGGGGNGGDGEDTIFALSSGYTGSQATAVAVLRISGPNAHEVLQKLSSPKTKLPPPRKAVLRKLYNHPQNEKEEEESTSPTSTKKSSTMIDHALVLLFQQPNSFTGEDLVELQCHGSRAVIAQLLEILPTLGCRMAEPGEFTQRAFGRGKLDLVQVEALADLLGADTSSQLQQALSQLDGRLSTVYETWRSQLISGLAHAEAVIDFGDDERLGDEEDEEEHEDDVHAAQWNIWGNVQGRMETLKLSMIHHLQDSRRGELVREGVNIAIVGPPNAGKSSLFNLLARRDAAIVSPIAGTTRDVLEVSLDLGGIKCILSDTAGVRSESSTSDSLELEGMKRTRVAAEKADFVVAMVDATEIDLGLEIVKDVLQQQQDQQEDDAFDQNKVVSSSSMSSDHVMLVLNKLDLINGTIKYPPNALLHDDGDDGTNDRTEDPGVKNSPLLFGGTYEISCETQMGIDAFLDGLSQTVQERIFQQGSSSMMSSSSSQDSSSSKKNDGTTSDEGALITRARHRQHVQAASEALERFDILSRQGSMAVDMAAEELRLAASELGRITGAVDVEDVLDVLFNDFCIGK